MEALSVVFESLSPDTTERKAPFVTARVTGGTVFALAGHLFERSETYPHLAPQVLSAAASRHRRETFPAGARIPFFLALCTEPTTVD
jgi:hypothetical protein